MDDFKLGYVRLVGYGPEIHSQAYNLTIALIVMLG